MSPFLWQRLQVLSLFSSCLRLCAVIALLSDCVHLFRVSSWLLEHLHEVGSCFMSVNPSLSCLRFSPVLHILILHHRSLLLSICLLTAALDYDYNECISPDHSHSEHTHCHSVSFARMLQWIWWNLHFNLSEYFHLLLLFVCIFIDFRIFLLFLISSCFCFIVLKSHVLS